MLVSSQHQQFRDLLDEQNETQRNRFIDLQILWRRKKTGEILYKAGGKWDKQLKQFSQKPATTGRIIDLEESQINAARWAAWWMQEFKAGRPRDFFSLFLYGNRGSGKTHFASIFLVTLAIEFPIIDGSSCIAWQVSSSHNERDELDREISDNFPFKELWYKYVEHPKHEYRFVNGARIVNVSANDTEDLKRGRVDFILINEAQKMRKVVTTFGVGRLSDKGGLAVFTSNPPTESKAQWILDWHEKEEEYKQAGLTFPVKFLYLDNSHNSHQDKRVAGQIAEAIRFLDPRLAQADIDGLMLRIGQPAYWEYNKFNNVQPAPDLGDITREFTKNKYYRAFDFVGGVDFQRTPHMAAAIFKIYGTIDNPILYAVDEFVVEQATEDDLIDEIVENGYTPETILFIGDGSGKWQDGKHVKGERDSFKVFEDRRFHITPPVKPKDRNHRPKNPPVEHRLRLTNAMLKNKQFMLHPTDSPKLIEAMRECEIKMGKYNRLVPMGFYAHLSDAAGYVCWWARGKPAFKKKDGPLVLIADMPKPKIY